MFLHEIIDQLESCHFTCEAGPLENNIAFIELKKLLTLPFAIKWTGENFGEIANLGDTVFGPYGREDSWLEVESLFGRIRVHIGDWVMAQSHGTLRVLGPKFTDQFEPGKYYTLEYSDDSHVRFTRGSHANYVHTLRS